MKRFLILIFCLCAFASAASAQFTTTATLTISRKSDTQNKADQALLRDIERFVVYHAGAVVNPTQKDAQGNCLPFTTTIGSKTINVDVYNRDASTCAVAIVNSKTDIKGQAAMVAILNRLINAQFNFFTDTTFVADATATAAKTAETSAKSDTTRAGEKVDPPQ